MSKICRSWAEPKRLLKTAVNDKLGHSKQPSNEQKKKDQNLIILECSSKFKLKTGRNG